MAPAGGDNLVHCTNPGRRRSFFVGSAKVGKLSATRGAACAAIHGGAGWGRESTKYFQDGGGGRGPAGPPATPRRNQR